MIEKFEYRILNNLEELSKVQKEVESFDYRYDISSKSIYNINLVLDELLSNIINYGFDDELEHEIVIRFVLFDDEVTIEIEDDGREFNPFEMPEPDLNIPLEDRPIGGLGVFLVKKFADDLHYEYNNGFNKVIISLAIEIG